MQHLLGGRERSLDLGLKGGWTGQERLPEQKMLMMECVWQVGDKERQHSRTEGTLIPESESYSMLVMAFWVPDTGSQLTLA